MIKFQKKKKHYICIAAISVDSVLQVEKKIYPQVYLEQCKYKLKKRKPVDFIDASSNKWSVLGQFGSKFPNF